MELWELVDLSTPWCVHVAGTLRIADHIAAGHTDVAELAKLSSADQEALHRVLRHLVNKGIFLEPSPGHFELNETARAMTGESAQVTLDLNGFAGRMAYAWGTLLSAVRTGRPAYHEVFGRSFWDDLDANPDVAASFNALMGPAGHGTPDPDVLVDASDWASIRHVVDVGGGKGYLLAEVLRAHPEIRGTLVDFPRTVEGARDVFESAGAGDCVTIVGQSFFDPLPAGADVYMMKSVLSDWPDKEAAEILRRCADAARPNGRVVAVNGVTPEERADPDLLMLVLVGGKHRTLPEFQELARQAGLEVSATGRRSSGPFIVECRPA